MDRELLTYPTWERYTVLSNVIGNMNIRDRRQIFQLARKSPISPDLFFPCYGFTFSEFAVWYLLKDTKGKVARRLRCST